MQNFNFQNPVQIVFGKGEITKVTSLIPTDKKVLVTYGGGSIKKNGVYEQVQAALTKHTWIEFGGIEPNPKYETLMQAVQVSRKEQVDFILAVGGGSIIDGTKFISAAIKFPGEDPWDMFTRKASVAETVPFGAIQTLPATGSEMNMFAVVTRGLDKLGLGAPSLYPQFAILDPETTYTLPERQLANGIVDAFVHVCEQYLTKNVNTPLQDRMAEGILKTLIAEAPKVIELKDYDSRANYMWCTTMALNGLIGSGVVHDWATHMIGHEITALYGVDHARTLAMIMPSLLRQLREQKKEKLLMFAHNVWDIKSGNNEEKIEQAILCMEDFFNSVGVPTKLRLAQIKESDISQIVEAVTTHHPYSLGEAQNIDKKMIEQILRKAL